MRLDGNRVRHARYELGYTLEEVSSEAGVAKGTAIRAEHNMEIQPSSARKIAEAFGLKIADLLPDVAPLPNGGAPAKPGSGE